MNWTTRMHHFHQARPLKRALQAGNSSAAAFSTTILPQILQPGVRPSGDGTVDIAQDGSGYIPSHIKVWALGVGAAANTFALRIYGWHNVKAQNGPPPLDMWIPQVISEATWTLGSTTGVANGVVPATELFGTSAVLVTDPNQLNQTGTFGETINTSTATAALLGYLIIPLHGAHLITFDFKQGTGSPTMNALYGFIGG